MPRVRLSEGKGARDRLIYVVWYDFLAVFLGKRGGVGERYGGREEGRLVSRDL